MHSSEQMGRQVGKGETICLKYPVMDRNEGAIHPFCICIVFLTVVILLITEEFEARMKDQI